MSVKHWLVSTVVISAAVIGSVGVAGAAPTAGFPVDNGALPLDDSGSQRLDPSSGTITITASSSTPSPVSPTSQAPATGAATATATRAGSTTEQPASADLLPYTNGLCDGTIAGRGICIPFPQLAPTAAPAAPAAVPPAAPAPQITPAQLATQAESQIQLPAPNLSISPNQDTPQIVNAPTWAWQPSGAFTPLTATATAGPITVTATATPDVTTLTYQDGGITEHATCTSAGTPYSDQLADQEDPDRPLSAASPDCGFTYHYPTASNTTTPLTATTTYIITWTITGAPGGGNLGTLTSPPTTHNLTINQIETVNTP